MSGIFKAIGKVFKAVVKVVKKIALPLLVVGAVVLTGGAALGALPAIGSVLGSAGITGALGGVLTSAISTAGYGALAGAAGAAITGHNVLKGALHGGEAGFITGGVLGGVGLLNAPAGGVSASTTPATADAVASAPTLGGSTAPFNLNPVATDAAGNLTGGGINTLAPRALDSGALTQALPSVAGSTLSAAAPATAAPAAQAGQAARPSLLNSFLNPAVLGPTIQGVGSGIAQWASTKELSKAEKKKRDAIAANYGVLNSAANPDYSYMYSGKYRPPSVAFAASNFGGKYDYDKAQGKVVFVPNGDA